MRSAIKTREKSAARGFGELAGQFARFGTVGAVVAGFNYAGFVLLLMLGMNYVAACVISWIPSVVLSYFLNRSQTFQVGRAVTAAEVARFAASSLLQLGTAIAGLMLLVEVFGLSPLPASLINIVIGAVLNFAVLRSLVFVRAKAPL